MARFLGTSDAVVVEPKTEGLVGLGAQGIDLCLGAEKAEEVDPPNTGPEDAFLAKSGAMGFEDDDLLNVV